MLDEAVLHRLIGSPKITYDQLVHLADMSMRSYICVQVVPASTGAHAGLGGAFMIATADDSPTSCTLKASRGRQSRETLSSRRRR